MPHRAISSISLVILLSALMIQFEPAPAIATDSELFIPKTLPYENLFDGEGFTFDLGCDPENGTPDDPSDDLACSAKDKDVLEYPAHGMPYLYSEAVEGNHDHAWWVAGDREAYHCAYAFMYDKHPNPFGGQVQHPDGHFIARVTVVRPLGQGYGLIRDTAMEEGQRWYDGSVYDGTGATEIPEENCRDTSLDPDFDYEAYVPKGPEEIRVGLFRADGEVSDIRDFADLEGHYEFLSLQDFGGPNGPEGATSRITLVRVESSNQKVSHVVYYDTMSDGRAAVEVDGTLVAETCVPDDPDCLQFLDIAESTFVADITWLAAEGITRGCNPPDNDLFCPNDDVTRGEMAAFLTRALDLTSGPDLFRDDESSTFEDDINALAKAGITLGCNPPDNDRFCPNDDVTRGQMAAFLTRAFDLVSGPDLFGDDESSTFEDDINALARAEITLGCNPPANDHFCPNDDVTRGQMAAFLHRASTFFP